MEKKVLGIKRSAMVEYWKMTRTFEESVKLREPKKAGARERHDYINGESTGETPDSITE